MAIWKDIAEALSPGETELARAQALYQEYRSGDLLEHTQSSLLRTPDAVMALFYSFLEGDRAPRRPGREEKDSSWMLQADFCYLNPRACTDAQDTAGTFLQAAKILPAMAANAIHLAPFHPCHYELVYVPETQTLIEPALADARLNAKGIRPSDQLRAFVQACQLLGKAVGFDLLPYAAQFGRVVFERPELFRWIRLNEDRGSVADGAGFPRYEAADRIENAERVRAIVTAVREDYGTDSLKPREGDGPAEEELKSKAYFASIKQCMDEGLWPVLMNPWNGVGIPAFAGYDAAGGFPLFSYRDQDGADASAEASGVVSPYAFYDGVPSTLCCEADTADGGAISRNEDAIRYYVRLFQTWRDDFGFDFVRYDSVDRLLDSCADDEGRVPLADRPTPTVIAEAIAQSREGMPGVGALADRLLPELDDFASLGFDVLIGSDMLRRMDAPLLNDSFALYDRLTARSAQGLPRASACFAIDAHDTGDPRRWGSSMTQLMGPERMRLRHAIARFLSVGAARRPLYETMGCQDMSGGLYEAETSIRGLSWADDAEFARGYAALERLYHRLKPFLDGGSISARHVNSACAWWVIRGKAEGRVLAVACSLETAEGIAPGRIDIPLGKGQGALEGSLYRTPRFLPSETGASETLSLELSYLEFAVADLSPAFY